MSGGEENGGKTTGDELEATSDVNGGRTKTNNRTLSATKGNVSARPTSAASSRQPVQKVVYYQNRFITVNIDPVTGRVVEASGPVLNTVGGGGAGSVSGQGEPGKDGGSGGGTGLGNRGKTKTKTASGASGAAQGTMSAIEIDTMQHDPHPHPGGSAAIAGRPSGGHQAGKAGKFGQFKVPSCLKTCHMYCEDNRMKTGSDDTKEKLKDNNKMQDQTNMCLKKVLNIIFVTTGVSLFLAVVIVIIYTSIGK